VVAVETWGRRCSPPRRSPASTHLSQAWSSGYPLCNRCPAGWHLSRLRMWSVERGEGAVSEIPSLFFTPTAREQFYSDVEHFKIHPSPFNALKMQTSQHITAQACAVHSTFL